MVTVLNNSKIKHTITPNFTEQCDNRTNLKSENNTHPEAVARIYSVKKHSYIFFTRFTQKHLRWILFFNKVGT